MATPEQKLETLLKDFENTDPNAAKGLRKLLDDTPELKRHMLDAVASDRLEKIVPLDLGLRLSGVYGLYNPKDKSIALPTAYLEISDHDKTAANTMRITAGHELQHAIRKSEFDTIEDAFKARAKDIAEGPSPHDYTRAIKQRVDALREQEARDEIAGVNVLAAHVKRANPKATLEDLYNALPGDMSRYIDVSGALPNLRFTAKPGLSFGSDLTLATTPENIEAMGKHYFDVGGNPQLYGAVSLKIAAKIEKDVQGAARLADPQFVPPKVQVNLDALEMKGAKLPPGFDNSSRHVVPGPAEHRPAPHASPGGGRINGGSSPPGDWVAPPALYAQSLAALEKLGADSGLVDRGQRDAVAAAMAVQAQKDGLRRIDAVIPSTDGKGLIAVQGEAGASAVARSYIDREDAIRQRPEDNLALLAAREVPARGIETPQPRPAGPAL